MDEFRGRVAVITGGGGGIGAALARAFAARGARLVLADLDEAAMARVAAPLTAGGTEVLTVRTDVGELAAVEALAAAAERRVSVLCPMVVETDINANSVRNRPADLRNPGQTVVPSAADVPMAGSVIAPDEVARRVVRAIERKDLYVFTHAEQRTILQRRAARQ